MKKRSFNQVLSCVLSLLMIIGMVPVMRVSAVTTTVTEVEGTTESGLEYEINDGEVIITDYTGSATELIIPSEIEDCPVTSIGDYAFSGCHGLTSITIPSNVTSIGDFAFDWCSLLSSISIPESVKSIGDSSFSNCISLTSVEFPSSVTSIGEGAFRFCESLADVYYGSTQTQWNEIEISNNNYNLLNAEIHFIEHKPTQSEPDADTTNLSGDANTDGCVNIKDATAIQKHIAKLIVLTDEGYALADSDGSGYVDIKDATAIQKCIAGLEY